MTSGLLGLIPGPDVRMEGKLSSSWRPAQSGGCQENSENVLGLRRRRQAASRGRLGIMLWHPPAISGTHDAHPHTCLHPGWNDWSRDCPFSPLAGAFAIHGMTSYPQRLPPWR